MSAVTQLIPNFIGGVSTLSDERKLPGQVREINNGYADPVYGLTKRNGFMFNQTLDTYTDSDDELADAAWFFINRDPTEAYFGCITTNQKIRIWDAINLAEVPQSDIDYQSTATDYLTAGSGHGDYKFVTVQDRTYIINTGTKVEERDGTVYKLKEHATVKLMTVEDQVEYEIIITPKDGQASKSAKFKSTRGNKITPGSDDNVDNFVPEDPTNAEDILSILKEGRNNTNDPDNRFTGTGLEELVFTGGFTITVKQFATSLEIESNAPFDIDVKAGYSGQALETYQDEIGNSTRLAVTASDGRRVKVINTTDERAAFFVKFVANDDDADGGTGYWEEGLGWSLVPKLDADGNPILDSNGNPEKENRLAAPGLNNAKMPHQLFTVDRGKFVYAEIEYTDRLVGSQLSNSSPSFVGNTISNGFIYNNRLGFLSGENVILSKSGQFIEPDFYYTTAQTLTADDPIDLNCSSIRPAKLYAAIPQVQGLILFSNNEQFNLYSDTDSLSPLDAIVRSISNYESTLDIEPVDVGTTIIFNSKTPSFTRTMALTTQGANSSPNVIDISKVSAEYVPKSIDFLCASTQNSFIAMTSQDENYVYIYRFFNNGERDIMQAWFRWELPGKIQTMVVVQDQVFVIVKNNGEYNLLGASLAQSATAGMRGLPNVNPRIDMFYTPLYYKQTNPITYDSTTDLSTIPKPYANSSDYEPIVIQVNEIQLPSRTRVIDIPISFVNDDDGDLNYLNVGYFPEVIVDDSGNWKIKGDWTNKEQYLLAGIRYKFEVELPVTYFRTQGIADYTAILTLSRYKFSFGNTGFVEFESEALGSNEWNKIEPVPDANYYLANNVPYTPETIITVPIYQKNKYFNFKIVSDSPAPVSINSMMWEGQYSPKYYRRAG